jgi:ParB-like chromosome segregation protein Spo0J
MQKVAANVVKKGQKVIEKNFNTLEALRVFYIPHGMISPNQYNPNRQSEFEFELLLKSMSEDGFTQPIVTRPLFTDVQAREALGLPADASHKDIDWLAAAYKLKSGFMVVDGEHRWKAARELGYADVPCVVTYMTDAQMRIATLRHNRARGTEDITLTAEVLRDLEKLGALDHAADSLQMDDVEIQKLLSEATAVEDLGQNEQFNKSWEVNTANVPAANPEDGFNVGMTAKAIEEQRRIQKANDEAKSNEERQMVQKSSDLVRIMLVFQGDEAKLVQRVLGKSQAETLLDICRRELAANPSRYE